LATDTCFWANWPVIGRPALEANAIRARQNFTSSFKRDLARSPLLTVARANGRSVSAREINRLFLRELFAEVKRQSGERVRDLVVTTPVEAFETYRAEIAGACQAPNACHSAAWATPIWTSDSSQCPCGDHFSMLQWSADRALSRVKPI
jgi:hypothetical protein